MTNPSAIPRTTPGQPLRRGIAGFLQGMRYPLRGARFVYREHPSLVRYWIVPIGITLAALTGVTYLIFANHDALIGWLWSRPEGEGALVSVLRGLRVLTEILVTVVAFVVSAFLVIALSTALASPFNDALSEQVERIVTGAEPTPFRLSVVLRDAVRSVLLELLKLSLYFAVMLPLFIASWLIPLVGPALYSTMGFTFTSCYFALDYVDWPLSRRGHGIHARLGLLQRHFGPMFGLGVGIWALMLVPVLNLFFMPAAVAGGTLLVLDLESTTGPRPGQSLEQVGTAG